MKRFYTQVQGNGGLTGSGHQRKGDVGKSEKCFT